MVLSRSHPMTICTTARAVVVRRLSTLLQEPSDDYGYSMNGDFISIPYTNHAPTCGGTCIQYIDLTPTCGGTHKTYTKWVPKGVDCLRVTAILRESLGICLLTVKFAGNSFMMLLGGQ